MAFKFKTKKRPSLGQAIAGGFAQGVSAGLQRGAELSLQDRLKKKEEFKEFRKNFGQAMNYIDVSDTERTILRDAQSRMQMGTLKNVDEVVTYLNAKSPNLGFNISGAKPPEVFKSAYGGIEEVRYSDGKAKVKTLRNPIFRPTKTPKPPKTIKEKQFQDLQRDIIEDANLVGDPLEDYIKNNPNDPAVKLYSTLQAQGNEEMVAESTNVQPQAMEGMTIINPNTGERLMLKDGQWQPIK